MRIADRINQVTRRVPAWPIYIVGTLLPVWLFWQATTGGLGVDPIEAIEETLGLWGLKLIVVGLCITPLRRFAGVNLIRFRRAIGLLTFFYIALHFLTWLLLDLGLRWEQALGDIIKRPYITMGMVGLLAMIPLALTSNNYAVRKLGAARWRKLHKLVYLAAVAGAVHFLWLVKAWPLEPFLYLGAILGLLAVRMIPKRPRLAA
ncbi:MAG: protein-methionine-sulfoxide reductase heme-binding subunit MsrQ [Albidovulum sp.]|uniref:protein-methionine-sulfoxide reductase heme-binding subunit MsrQ n=1 Tax=Albidovulum sp. TaxID=1872424 RepID=UPI003CA452FC